LTKEELSSSFQIEAF